MNAGNDALYERLGKTALRPAWELLQRIHIDRGERVLEAPCHTGDITCWIAGLVGGAGRVLAVDPDRNCVSLTRRALRERGLPQGEVAAADLQALGRLGTFDVVFAHMPGPRLQSGEPFLRAVIDNLRPGGRFALQMPAAGFCPDLSEAVDACLARRQPPVAGGAELPTPFFASSYWLPDRQELEQELERVGFREFDVTGKLAVERFETLTDASDHFLATSLEPLLAALPADARPAFLEDLRRELLHRLGRAENLEIVFRRVFAYGRR